MSPPAVDKQPQHDQAAQVAAALDRIIQSNHVANEDLKTPCRDQGTAQQSPYQQAFETFIDQTKFTPVSSRLNQEDTPEMMRNIRLTQEELESIALVGRNPFRVNTPPPANDKCFLDHRVEQEDLLDHDMDQDNATRHETQCPYPRLIAAPAP